MHKALVGFHYAADRINAVRYEAGDDVPVKPEDVDQLVIEGKIEGRVHGAPLDLADVAGRAALPSLDPQPDSAPVGRTKRK